MEKSSDPDEVVAVYWPLDHLEADAIRQALAAEGIWSHLEGEMQASWESSGAFGNAGRWRMRLVVRAANADRARQLIGAGSWPRFG